MLKKFTALVLCIVMMASFVGCGGSSDTDGNSADGGSANGTNTEVSAPVFDTGWAGAEYVMLIPEPPFEYEIVNRNGFIFIKTADDEANDTVTHQIILDYCEQLKNAGFNVNVTEKEIGERYGRICYEFSAFDAAGNGVGLVDDGGGVMINVEAVQITDTENSSEAIIPPLPACDWTRYDVEGYEQYGAENVDFTLIERYIDTLDSNGWNISQSGRNWYCTHSNSRGSVQVFYNEAENFASITITEQE